MKTGLFIFLVSIIFIDCNNNNHIPSSILKPSKMQDVMWDMVRADQLLNENILKKDSSLNRETESIKLYEEVFYIHKITKDKFQKSFSFYRLHPDLLKVILDSINARVYNAPTRIYQPKPSEVKPAE